jgi:CCR4-NOT transcriptional complex subunit CAF120
MGMGMGMMGSGGPSPYGPPIQPRPQTPGNMGMRMDGGAPSPYNLPPQARPQTPGGMGMMGGGAPTAYAPSMAGMNNRSMSPGPGLMSPARFGQGPPPRPQMMPHANSYGNGAPVPQGFPQGFPQGNGWNMGNMPQRPGPPPMPSPGMGFGMQGGRPQSPAYQLPPQGQYAPPPGTPGGPRPGTPGRMQFQGQAF